MSSDQQHLPTDSSPLQAYTVKKMDDQATAVQQHVGEEDDVKVDSKEPEEHRVKCRKLKHKKKKKEQDKVESDSSSSSSENDSGSDKSDSTASTDSEDSSDDEKRHKRSAAKRRAKHRKHKSIETEDSESDRPWKSKQRSRRVREESTSSDTESEVTDRRSRRKRKSKTVRSDTDKSDEDDDTIQDLAEQIDALKIRLEEQQDKIKSSRRKSKRHVKSKRSKKEKSPDYKRVDQLWDSTIHNYKLRESAEDDDSEFADYAFLVRRKFDWENKYTSTVVDIKSKDLRDALAVVMKDCKSVSLEAEEPTVDPNILFLYVEKLRTYRKNLKTQMKKEKKKKRKTVKKLESQRAILKVLVKYIDTDYADIKKTLYPLVAAGNITFDLIWALWAPGEIAITSTYGVWDEPRCFKVDYANKYNSLSRGEYYNIEGRYLEYDGKGFGYGEFEAEIDSFKGPRKINSLAAYPLKYHRDEAAIRKHIIARGKRFVETEGMNYKFHKGLAFMKKKKQVLKININGRVMVDPATFRRINPNYQVSTIKAKDVDDLFSECESDEDCSCASDDEDRAGKGDQLKQKPSDNDEPKIMYKFVEDDEGGYVKVAVEVDENGDPIRNQKVEQLQTRLSFSEDDLLLTTSVVLGFAFSEKLWLEFTLSGVREIEYNEHAFESLVLPPNQKDIVKALVESHKFNAAKTIDDVVQGKGKGLVAVLHGPPGTGKTVSEDFVIEGWR